MPGWSTSPDILALYDRTENVCQLGQRDPCELITFHTWDIAVTNSIFNEDDFITLLHSFASSSRNTNMGHVASESDLLDTPRLKGVVQRCLLERAGELLPDNLLTILQSCQPGNSIYKIYTPPSQRRC